MHNQLANNLLVAVTETRLYRERKSDSLSRVPLCFVQTQIYICEFRSNLLEITIADDARKAASRVSTNTQTSKKRA